MVRMFGSSTSVELGQLAGRLAVARQLVAQAAAGEERQLQLLLQVVLPQLLVGDPSQALPEAALGLLVVDVVQVAAQLREQVRHGRAEPGGGRGRRW